MTDRLAGDQSPSREAPGEAAAMERLRAKRLRLAESRSLLALIPRRDLAKVALLLVLLVAIIAIQQRSGSLVKRLNEVFFGPPPPTQAVPREAPRVRLEMPVKTP